jgi:hypothetical protein
LRARAVLGRDLRELQAKRNTTGNTSKQEVESIMDHADDPILQEADTFQAPEATTTESDTHMDDMMRPETVEEAISSPTKASSPQPKIESPPSSVSPVLDTKTEVQPPESEGNPMSDNLASDDKEEDPFPIISSGVPIPENLQGLGITTAVMEPSASSEAPMTSELQAEAFDSMFDNNDHNEGDMNFDDFDFSGDGSGNQNPDFDSSGGVFDLSSFGNQTSNDNAEAGALLQGLDSFGDGTGGDFAMLDLSNDATGNLGNVENSGNEFGMSGGDLDTALGMGVNDSTFDDLLDGMDFGDGADGGTGGDMMEHGDFDDEFFGINNED